MKKQTLKIACGMLMLFSVGCKTEVVTNAEVHKVYGKTRHFDQAKVDRENRKIRELQENVEAKVAVKDYAGAIALWESELTHGESLIARLEIISLYLLNQQYREAEEHLVRYFNPPVGLRIGTTEADHFPYWYLRCGLDSNNQEIIDQASLLIQEQKISQDASWREVRYEDLSEQLTDEEIGLIMASSHYWKGDQLTPEFINDHPLRASMLQKVIDLAYAHPDCSRLNFIAAKYIPTYKDGKYDPVGFEKFMYFFKQGYLYASEAEQQEMLADEFYVGHWASLVEESLN